MNRLLLIFALSSPLTADAAELVWEGHYRARGQYFNSLSLSDTNTGAEGAAGLIDHRLRLQPGWLMSDHVGLHAQIDMLPYVLWGEGAVQREDPVAGLDPAVLTQTVAPPTTEEGASTLENIQVTRVWAEVQTRYAQVRFGRMPVEWGTGMVYNAGNDPWDEFGDTADRLQVSGRAGQVYLLGAFEVNNEQFVGEQDDIWTATAAVMYPTERASAGLYNTFRRYSYDDATFGLYTLDLWGEAKAGPLQIEGEFAAQIGRGALDEGISDATIAAFGAHLGAALQADKLTLGLAAGLAGGDKDDTDARYHTFTFDPDFNLGTLFLFEEPMPILEPTVKNETNAGRELDAALTGYSVRNALYLRPRVGWRFLEGLEGELSATIAQAAALPDENAEKGYGTEFDARVVYEPFSHFSLDGTLGLFVPGGYFSSFEDADLGGGFDQPAVGGQLIGTVEF